MLLLQLPELHFRAIEQATDFVRLHFLSRDLGNGVWDTNISLFFRHRRTVLYGNRQFVPCVRMVVQVLASGREG